MSDSHRPRDRLFALSLAARLESLVRRKLRVISQFRVVSCRSHLVSLSLGNELRGRTDVLVEGAPAHERDRGSNAETKNSPKSESITARRSEGCSDIHERDKGVLEELRSSGGHFRQIWWRTSFRSNFESVGYEFSASLSRCSGLPAPSELLLDTKAPRNEREKCSLNCEMRCD